MSKSSMIESINSFQLPNLNLLHNTFGDSDECNSSQLAFEMPRPGHFNYSYVFPFEKDFNNLASTVWMHHHWHQSIVISLLYVLFVHWLQWFMKDKAALKLDGAMQAWNWFLALFSVVGCLRMSPEFFHALLDRGFEYSMCNASYGYGVTGYWTEKFAVSKALELGDTAFIVLRKRPLLFLHWYHHITVLVYTWHAYKDHTAGGRWFIWMNYTVHSFMYCYYALRSMKVRFPKWSAMCITVMQLSQMIVGVVIPLNSFYIKSHGGRCQQTWQNLYLALAMYLSYFVLFANFFWHTYLKADNRYVRLRRVEDEENKLKQKLEKRD